jgi:cyclopropane fatty-acyl-phospholipid synthase-like methyltransferase
MNGTTGLLASCIRPGDAVLYVGPSGPRFFEKVKVQRPTSRSTRTVFHPTLDGKRFDAIVARSVVEVMTDDEIDAWTLRANELLAPKGRLVIAIRSVISTGFSGADFGLDAVSDVISPERLANPYSAVQRIEKGGFVVTDARQRWSAISEALVLERAPSIPDRSTQHSATSTR